MARGGRVESAMSGRSLEGRSNSVVARRRAKPVRKEKSRAASRQAFFSAKEQTTRKKCDAVDLLSPPSALHLPPPSSINRFRCPFAPVQQRPSVCRSPCNFDMRRGCPPAHMADPSTDSAAELVCALRAVCAVASPRAAGQPSTSPITPAPPRPSQTSAPSRS